MPEAVFTAEAEPESLLDVEEGSLSAVCLVDWLWDTDGNVGYGGYT